MYEVEYKVEITEEERAKLIDLLVKTGFSQKEVVTQNDYYIEAKESVFGGNDLRRYRDEGQKIFYTEKIWENINGQKARKETEGEVSRKEFEVEILKYPNTLKIKKERQSFAGIHQNKKIHIDMDSVKFDHSSNMRYFVEAEILVEDKNEVKIYKDLVEKFIQESLKKDDTKESPGMFSMAFNKL